MGTPGGSRGASQVPDREELLRASAHMEAGGFVVRIPAAEDDAKATAVGIRRDRGALHVTYMGKWSIGLLL